MTYAIFFAILNEKKQDYSSVTMFFYPLTERKYGLFLRNYTFLPTYGEKIQFIPTLRIGFQ